MKQQLVKLAEILPDTTYQFRVTSLGKNVPELKRLMSDGIEVDPVVLWKQPQGYIILDGNQRVEAARAVHGPDAFIAAKIVEFPPDDHKSAFLYAIRANQKHGAQLDKQDRANMAKQMLKTFPDFSNVVIAQRCGLAESTVRGYRIEMPEAQTQKRTGLDGRTTSLPKNGSKPKAQAPETLKELGNMESDVVESDSDDEASSSSEEDEYDGSDSNCELAANTEGLEKAETMAVLYKHEALEAMNFSVDELSGFLNDAIDELTVMRDYVECLPHRSELKDEDIGQAAAILDAITVLGEWNGLSSVREAYEEALRVAQ